MKIHKKTILILVTISIVLFTIIIEANYKLCIPFEDYLKKLMPRVFIGQRGFIINLLMGILGSIIVSIVIEIINYNVAKKNCIITFLQKANELNVLFSNITEAFSSSREIKIERDMYKAVLDYDMGDLYNCFFDIDFIFKKNKYSVVLRDIYYELSSLKNKVESMRKKILFNDISIFEKHDEPVLYRYFFRIQPLEGKNGFQQIFYSKEITNKIEIVENYLFKSVWYLVEPPYDLLESLCQSKLRFLFDKLSGLILNIKIIKWSPVIKKNYVNYYNLPEFLKFKRLLCTKYMFYYNRPIKIDCRESCMDNEVHKKEKNKNVSLNGAIIVSVLVSVVLVVLDYNNIPTLFGFEMKHINWNFLMGILNCIIVVMLYVVTYNTLDKRTAEREKNKTDNTMLLLKVCYKECTDYVRILDEKVVNTYIVPKIDFNSPKNAIVANLQESPFVNENIIMDLVKDGQVTQKQIESYIEIKKKYREYINMRITVYDAPEIYEPLAQELNELLEKEILRFDN